MGRPRAANNPLSVQVRHEGAVQAAAVAVARRPPGKRPGNRGDIRGGGGRDRTALEFASRGPNAAISDEPIRLPGTQLAELWSVRTAEGDDIRAMPQRVRENAKYLREHATGRLAPRFAAALGDPELRDRLVGELLRSEFPETLHEGILAEVGLAQHVRLASTPRDPKFQRVVPMAYEFRCSFCDFSALMLGEHVGLDAAHVRMHSKDGPSTVDNGILLCALHHRLFDKGALGLDENRRILVSQQLSVVDSVWDRSLLDLSGRSMRLPQRAYLPPALEHIEWHHENLFKKPARAPA